MNLNKQSYQEFFSDLKENLSDLKEYQKRTNQSNRRASLLRDALEDADPFVVFRAAAAAELMLASKSHLH